jgi:hypothetical protein
MTAVIIPSETPTQAGILTQTPILPTPALEDSEIAEDILFSNSGVGCQLPCWQNLKIGISNRYDVQDTFDRVFGFHGMQDFFNPIPAGDEILFDPLDLPNLYYTGHIWRHRNNMFMITAWITKSQDTLYAMEFEWIDYQPVAPTIQQIVRNMGAPSIVMLSGKGTGAANVAIISMVLLYKQGVAYRFMMGTQIESNEENGGKVKTAKICLDVPTTLTDVYLSDPYISGLDSLTDFQQQAVGDFIDSSKLTSIEEAPLNLSPEEFAAIASRDENACLTLH